MKTTFTAEQFEQVVGSLESLLKVELAKADSKSLTLAKAEEDDKMNMQEDMGEQSEDQNKQDAIEAVSGDESHEEPAQDQDAEQSEQEHSDEDLQALNELYSSLSPKELELHLNAIQKILEAQHSHEDQADQSAPEQAALEQASSDDKKENEADKENEDDKEVITKSEKQVDETSILKKELEELKKSQQETVMTLVQLFKGIAPARKAVTSVRETLAKSEDVVSLTRNEVIERLTRKASDQSLTKSDRELISAYTLKKASVEEIAHLLK